MRRTKKGDSLVKTSRLYWEWWSWGDLNPRPQAFSAQIYMFSELI